MSTTDFSPSYSASIRSNTRTNWNDTRATTGTVEKWSQCKAESQSWYEIYRGYFIYDTSALADNATVSAASLICSNITLLYKDWESSLVITHVTTASDTSFTSADYNVANFGTALWSESYATLTTGAKTFTLTNPTISKTGYTKFGMINGHDLESSQFAENAGSDNIQFAAANLTLRVTWTTPPVVTTSAATSIESTTATLGGNVTDAGGGTVSTRGVCWNTSSNPTTSNSKAATTGSTGAYTVSATGLTKNTLYYARAYVTTENSTTYGSNVTFTTDTDATVTTGSATNVNNTTAILGGNVTSDGNSTVTERGVCWATTINPTTSSSKATSVGTTGAYTVSATSLSPGSLYHYRAYVITAVSTQYGSDLTFVTPSGGIIFFN
jgi:hypothetical protein